MKLILIFLCGCIGSLTAAETVIVTLESVSDRVRAQNPQLQAARWWIDEAVGRARDAGRLSNPELESEFEAGPGMRERNVDIGLSQAFPVTGKLRLQKAISALDIQAAEAEVAHVERRLVAQAAEQVVSWLGLEAKLRLLDEQAQLHQKLSQSLADAATKGEVSLLDAGSARMEGEQLKLERQRMQLEKISLHAELKRLLGMRVDESLQVSGSLPELPSDDQRQAIGERPDLQVAKVRVETARRELQLENARRMDDVEVGVFASSMRREDEPEGIISDRMLGLRLTIPLPLWNRNQGAIDEARARQKRVEVELGALDQALHLQEQEILERMREWRAAHVLIHDELIPIAEKHVEIAGQAYHAGQGDLSTLLRARQQQLDLRMEALDALQSYHVARLQYAVVEILNR